jgi:hypothetical protein
MQRKRDRKKEEIPVEQCHLFRFRSPHALAIRLGVPLEKLERLAAGNKYEVFKLKSGRVVQEPEAALQALHRKIHRYLARIETPSYLHSTVSGASYVSNASTHQGTSDTVKVDVKKFFPSVPQHRVMHFFRDVMECSGDVAGLLANLICYKGFLATGSSASPIISYYAFKAMFDEMEVFASKRGYVLSVYVDDITMSGPNISWTDLQHLHHIIRHHGLEGHKSKISKGNKPRLITGVMICGSEIQLPFARWRKIHELRKALKVPGSASEKEAALNRLVSTLYEAAQIDPTCRRMAEHYHHRLRQLRAAKTQREQNVAA